MISNGYSVEVTGTVQPPALAATPVGGVPCVLYRVDLGLWQRLVGGWWSGHNRETGGTRFALCCRLGNLLLDPKAARITLNPRRRKKVRHRDGGPTRTRVSELYRRLSRAEPGGPVTCVEQWLSVGERVWVSGTLHTIDHPGGMSRGYRNAPTISLLRARRIVAL